MAAALPEGEIDKWTDTRWVPSLVWEELMGEGYHLDPWSGERYYTDALEESCPAEIRSIAEELLKCAS